MLSRAQHLSLSPHTLLGNGSVAPSRHQPNKRLSDRSAPEADFCLAPRKRTNQQHVDVCGSCH